MATTNMIGDFNIKTPKGGATPSFRVNGVPITTLNAPQNIVILNNLADLDANVPVIGGFRTFANNTNYLLSGDITSADPFICGNKMNLTANNQQAPTLTYSGTGDMFTAVDKQFTFNDIRFNCPLAQCYNFSAVGPGNALFKATEVVLLNATKFGTFDNLNLLTLNNCSGLNIDDGITLEGGDWTAVDIERMALISPTEAITCIDLTNSVHETLNINRVIFGGGVGSVAISGLANSANMSSGALSVIVLCNFLGIETTLSNITVEDIRFNFESNEGIDNSAIASDAFLSSTRTTPIGVQGDYVTIGGVNWTSDLSKRFSVSTGGVLTYLPEFQSPVLIIMTATVSKVGGGADEICAKIAINGVEVDKTISCTENSTPTTLTCVGLFVLTNGDTVEGMVANVDSTSDIIVGASDINVVNVSK